MSVQFHTISYHKVGSTRSKRIIFGFPNVKFEIKEILKELLVNTMVEYTTLLICSEGSETFTMYHNLGTSHCLTSRLNASGPWEYQLPAKKRDTNSHISDAPLQSISMIYWEWGLVRTQIENTLIFLAEINYFAWYALSLVDPIQFLLNPNMHDVENEIPYGRLWSCLWP